MIGNVIAEAGPWTFGWEALVAIGTLVLAIATGLLAWRTSALAKTTSNEVKAQRRPVLAQHAEGVVVYAPSNSPENRLTFKVENIGLGPALSIAAHLVDRKAALVFAVRPWDDSVCLAPNRPAKIVVDLPGGFGDEMVLELDYADVAGEKYHSAIRAKLDVAHGGLRIGRVDIGEGHIWADG